jgi:hypothetical protein
MRQIYLQHHGAIRFPYAWRGFSRCQVDFLYDLIPQLGFQYQVEDVHQRGAISIG